MIAVALLSISLYIEAMETIETIDAIDTIEAIDIIDTVEMAVSFFFFFYLPVHAQQELFVGSCSVHLLRHKVHGFDGCHIGKVVA